MKSSTAALLLTMTIGIVAAGAQAPASGVAGTLSGPKVYAFDQMAAKTSANGTEGRNMLRGLLATGESVDVHESVQPAGAAPVALHAIQHSELIVVREGELEFEHDGKSEKAGPGDVIYVAFGTVHRVKNVGSVPAKYVVVAIGGDTKK